LEEVTTAPTEVTEAPVSRLERRKARTRAAIVSAAGDLFSVQGFEATSVQQIALAADTGVGTVYGYFASKDALLEEVLNADRAEALLEYDRLVNAETPPVERVCTALEVLARYLSGHRTILVSSFVAGIRVHTWDGQPGGWVVGAVSVLISDGIARGDFRPVPVDTAARMLIGTTVSAFLGLGVWQGREEDPETLPGVLALARLLLLKQPGIEGTRPAPSGSER
jgi:AcrR family transcriptional regulator